MGKSVLVICNGGGIGDTLFATPVMRALRQSFDRVVALTDAAHRDAIAPSAADDIWNDDVSFLALRRRIASEQFGAAVITWASTRSALLAYFSGIPVRVGQTNRSYSALFTHKVALRSEAGDHTTSWSEILLDYARAIGCDGDPQPIAPIFDQGKIEAQAFLTHLGLAERPFIVLHPTRGISARRDRWPTSSLAALSTALREHYGMPVVVSGGVGDREIAEAVAGRSQALSIAGRTTLPQFTAIAQRAALVVALDSGPMHIAAAVGTPTVGIFPMQPDEPDRWRPLGPKTAVVRPEYPCPPGHRKETCPDFACVRAINVATVIAVSDGLLHKEREPEPR